MVSKGCEIVAANNPVPIPDAMYALPLGIDAMKSSFSSSICRTIGINCTAPHAELAGAVEQNNRGSYFRI
jgi:hypothetical protein